MITAEIVKNLEGENCIHLRANARNMKIATMPENGKVFLRFPPATLQQAITALGRVVQVSTTEKAGVKMGWLKHAHDGPEEVLAQGSFQVDTRFIDDRRHTEALLTIEDAEDLLSGLISSMETYRRGNL